MKRTVPGFFTCRRLFNFLDTGAAPGEVVSTEAFTELDENVIQTSEQGRVIEIPKVGGLHHHYERHAA
jgi:hypothetical protein